MVNAPVPVATNANNKVQVDLKRQVWRHIGTLIYLYLYTYIYSYTLHDLFIICCIHLLLYMLRIIVPEFFFHIFPTGTPVTNKLDGDTLVTHF